MLLALLCVACTPAAGAGVDWVHAQTVRNPDVSAVAIAQVQAEVDQLIEGVMVVGCDSASVGEYPTTAYVIRPWATHTVCLTAEGAVRVLTHPDMDVARSTAAHEVGHVIAARARQLGVEVPDNLPDNIITSYPRELLTQNEIFAETYRIAVAGYSGAADADAQKRVLWVAAQVAEKWEG